MPMDRKLYPDNWDDIATRIKIEVNWCCEGCGKPCRRPQESKDDFLARSHLPPETQLGKYVLTVAHLNHCPSENSRDNLKALCSVCHLRYDTAQMPLKRFLKRERLGQQKLNLQLTKCTNLTKADSSRSVICN